jgi:DNA helicase-2/ATP-dependent DNA helicase PcrA
MKSLALCLESGVDPFQVGFVSFTRAARREAANRAAALIGGSAQQLEADGWFRTLHSVCFRCLGVGRDNVLAGDRKSTRWVEDRLGIEVGTALGDSLDDEGGDFEARTDAGIALQLWSTARNRLEPLVTTWGLADRCSERTPDYEAVVTIVDRYEQAKRLDGASDFTDLLGRFAGWSFHPNGHERCRAEGDSPNLHVWFFDEQQDTSALLDSVCHRLIESATWVYVVGDPFQSIYGWAGADHSLFRKWPAAKEKIMPKSYRCPAAIHEFGEKLLRDSSDYWDRGIQPADHDGAVEIERLSASLLQEINPTQTWLVLARTNWLANRLATRLTEAGIPWRATRGNGGWPRRSRVDAVCTLASLFLGSEIGVPEWRQLLKLLPSKLGDETLLERGTKTEWESDWQRRKDERFERDTISTAGATTALVDRVRSGRIADLIDGGNEVLDAATRLGDSAVKTPLVRVGTIHSAKGAEADNVLWLTTTSDAVTRSCEDQRGFDEECRCCYVAATRARRRLILAVEPNQRHRWRLPA